MSVVNEDDSLDRSGQTFPLREAYPFAFEHQLETEASKIKSTRITWQRGTKSGVRRGFMIRLFQERGILEKFIEMSWQFGSTAAGKKMISWYTKISQEYDDFLLTGNDSNQEVSIVVNDNALSLGSSDETLEFALEAHLRDFIAKHLSKLEPGLKLFQENGTTGVEYPIDGGRIDILAVDSNNKFVVIELKLSRGRNKTLGQLLYYMGWVDQNLGSGPCRGIIVASDISDELAVAVSRVPGVTLSKYKMNFEIENVKQVS